MCDKNRKEVGGGGRQGKEMGGTMQKSESSRAGVASFNFDTFSLPRQV